MDFNKLKKSFPLYDRTYFNAENCDYCENIFNSKDCYFAFNGAELNGCLYNSDGFKEVDDIDCDNGVSSERCYESTDFANCTDCDFITHCVRCYNVSHSYMLTDCHDCFGCANLSNKAFCIYNIQLTKDEYRKQIKILTKKPILEIQSKLENVKKNFPKINLYFDDAVNSEYADYVFFVKNLYYCFDCSHSQDCGYSELSHYCQDCWDSLYALSCERSVAALFSTECYGSYELNKCFRCYNSFFLDNCSDCHDCFGCVNLSYKQYCILNIQYSKKEYQEKLKELKKNLELFFNQKLIAKPKN